MSQYLVTTLLRQLERKYSSILIISIFVVGLMLRILLKYAWRKFVIFERHIKEQNR